MNNYYKFTFELSLVSAVADTSDMLSLTDASDVLKAMLADVGFESFEDVNGQSFVAYIPERLYDPESIKTTIKEFPFNSLMNIKVCDIEHIEGKDWNEEWEKNYFKPYVFGKNKCVIHSTFHKDIPKCEYDIVIDPKMAFGTGHHSTTQLMVESLFRSDIKDKRVLDVGTGSAILAIIASKLGATKVEAVEIDEAAYTNAKENIVLNGCDNINVIHGVIGDLKTNEDFDIILANINRNIIMADMADYIKRLKHTGRIYLSGFYIEDVPMLENRATELGMEIKNVSRNDRWAMIELSHAEQ